MAGMFCCMLSFPYAVYKPRTATSSAVGTRSRAEGRGSLVQQGLHSSNAGSTTFALLLVSEQDKVIPTTVTFRAFLEFELVESTFKFGKEKFLRKLPAPIPAAS